MPPSRTILPMPLFIPKPPFVYAKHFDFSLRPAVSNHITYAVEADGRHIAFKILRSQKATHTHTQKYPPLLLLHGLGLHIASFRGLAEYLIDEMDLILLDYNGFAHDIGWPGGGLSIALLARTAARAAHALGISRLNIGGSSLGGGMSLLAAMMYPELFDSVVVFNPAIFPQPLPSFYRLVSIPIVGELVMSMLPLQNLVAGVTSIGYVNPARVDPELLAVYQQNMVLRENRLKLMDVIRHLPRRDAEVQQHLHNAANMCHQTLIVWGEQDRLLPPDAGRRLSELLPQAIYAPMPELSHLPHEESPEKIGPLVLDFIKGNLQANGCKASRQIPIPT